MDVTGKSDQHRIMVFTILCLFAAVLEFPVKAQSGDGYDLVFVANLDPPGIYVAPADTFNFTLIPGFDNHNDIQRPVAIDYDPIDAMVYWTDVQHSTISRAFLDGTGLVVLLRDLHAPDGLCLDVENRLMYWTDTGSDLIERATLDGQDRSLVLNLTTVSIGDVQPRAIVLDTVNSHLFWTDWGSSPKIERANTDGSSRMLLVHTELQWPNGLSLDIPGDRMYWCDAGLDRIESTNLLGQDRLVHADLNAYNIHPFDIWYYHDSLYWTDWRFTKLLHLDLLQTGPVELFGSASFQKGGGLHIYDDYFIDHSCMDLMPCNIGERCRQFQTSYECVCKDGLAGANCRLNTPCIVTACNNGGTCFQSASTSGGYFCQCPERYSGINCEIFDNPCNSGPCMNGGTCVVSAPGFLISCICPSDFIGNNCEAQSRPYDLVFVANLDPPGIYVAPADTFNFTLIPGFDNHSDIRQPVAIDYDPVDAMVYWTDIVLTTISRAFVDGTGLEVLLTDLQIPEGLSLDLVNRVMYWTDTGSDLIERATLDGQDRSVVLNLTDAAVGDIAPRAIIVDPINRYLYWTDWGAYPRIERSGVNGSNRMVLIDTNLQWPNGLALDLQGGRLYWCDASTDRIEYSDLLGQGRTILVDLAMHNIHPFDVAFYNDYIYWTDWEFASILRVDAMVTAVTSHGSESFSKSGGLHIYKDMMTDHSCQDMMPCQHDGQCRQYSSYYVCVCADGFTGVNCQDDVNECVDGLHTCDDNAVCINIPGSFTCACNVGYSGEGMTGSTDVNECVDGSHTCDDVNAVCTNTPGSFTCACNVGYSGDGMTGGTGCTDVNECVDGSHTCDVNAVCTNTPGSFTCACNVGYSGDGMNGGTGCTDVNECVDGSHTCDVLAACTNTPGSFTCACNVGYSGDGMNGGTGCTDVNECVDGSHTCDVLAACTNTPGSFTCACNVGYSGDGMTGGTGCTDGPDECVDGSHTCDVNAVCINIPGSFTCACNVGYSGDGMTGGTGCTDVNECVDGSHTCDVLAACTNIPGSFTCACNVGYSGDGMTGGTGCTDVNECVDGSHTCDINAACTNDVPGFTCTCNDGYSGDGMIRGTGCTDNEPPAIYSCPDDIVIPVHSSSSQAPHSWIPPIISDNLGPPDVVFGCLGTASLECNEAGSGTFAVGVTTVMYTATDMARNRNVCGFTVTVTVVDIVCPAEFTVLADPGSSRTSVNWPEPDLTGWEGLTNFSSNAQPGVIFAVGFHRVSYQQWFAMYNLVLDCSFSFEVVGRCASNTSYNGLLTWPVTIAGSTAKSVERCPLVTLEAGQPLAVRNCSVIAPPVYFQWENHEPRSCGDENNDVTLEEVAQVEVSQGNAYEVAEFLANQTSSNDAEDITVVSNILVNIANAESGDTEVTELVVATVNNVIMSAEQNPATTDIDGVSSSAIIQSVETQVSLTVQQEGQVSIQQDSIHVKAVSVDPIQASNGFSFVSIPQGSPQEGTLAGTEVKTFVNTSEIPENVVASIRLPANIVDLLQSSDDNSSAPLRASFIIFADDTLFQSLRIKVSEGDNGSSLQVAGSVVSLTVEDVELVNLTEPVVIEFRAPAINDTEASRTTIQCVFWDFDLNDEVGDWSTAGCMLARQTNTTVSCNCSHATNFAILVDVKGQQFNTSCRGCPTNVLDIISQVGCVLSIIALAITLSIYLAIRKLRTGKSRQIFIHFCVSLLMLYIVFLAGVDNAMGSGGGCVFVAALLHYLTLTTMMWMAVEARNMYVSTVKVFPEDMSRYMTKASLIAWGIPLVVLIISLAAGTNHYNNEHYCFLRPDLVLYLGLLVPIGLILIHNIITFILVMRSLLKVREVSRSQQISKRLQNAVGISALLGLTWCFGFLAINEAAFTFQLIFCLANSLQGVIVFVMFCVRREEVRTALAPYMKRICCGHDCRLPKLRPQQTYDLQLVSDSVPSSPSSVHTAEFDMSVSGIS